MLDSKANRETSYAAPPSLTWWELRPRTNQCRGIWHSSFAAIVATRDRSDMPPIQENVRGPGCIWFRSEVYDLGAHRCGKASGALRVRFFQDDCESRTPKPNARSLQRRLSAAPPLWASSRGWSTWRCECGAGPSNEWLGLWDFNRQAVPKPLTLNRKPETLDAITLSLNPHLQP